MQMLGVEFVDPYVGDCVVDLWLGRVELLVAETAPPYSEARGRWFRFTFVDVVEARAFKQEVYRGRAPAWRVGEPFQREELTAFGESDAAGEVEPVPGRGRRGRLTATAFRADLGFPWVIRADMPLRLVRLASWSMVLEFLYHGEAHAHELSDDEVARAWAAQRAQFATRQA